MPLPLRLLANIHDLLMGLLRGPLTDSGDYPGVKVGTLIPARMSYPFLLARRAGGSSIDPRFLDQPIVDLQAWATTDRQAENLAESARALLVLAWRNQTVVPGVGSISRFRDQALPTLLPDESVPAGIYRYQGSVGLAVRPAR